MVNELLFIGRDQLSLTASIPNHDVTEGARKATTRTYTTGAATHVSGSVITPAICPVGARSTLAAATCGHVIYGTRCITACTGSRGTAVRADMGADEGK